mmetsp:Transcript_79526/g.110489  ORF Transcript_79526/g.110489 Transcript_79526/m.110489 type:complete len:227 (+) Transcript_79526:131-811(+)
MCSYEHGIESKRGGADFRSNWPLKRGFCVSRWMCYSTKMQKMLVLSVALARRKRTSATRSASFDWPAKNLLTKASVRRYSFHPSQPCVKCARHLDSVDSPAFLSFRNMWWPAESQPQGHSRETSFRRPTRAMRVHLASTGAHCRTEASSFCIIASSCSTGTPISDATSSGLLPERSMALRMSGTGGPTTGGRGFGLGRGSRTRDAPRCTVVIPSCSKIVSMRFPIS